MNDKVSEAIARAARRAEQQPYFLASVFAAYKDAHELDDGALSARLGCAPSALVRLGLCRRPDPEQPQFSIDIDYLAEHFQLQPEELAAMVREIDALEALRRQMQSGQPQIGVLRAARDRESDNPTDEGA